jgi:hypothetical protein
MMHSRLPFKKSKVMMAAAFLAGSLLVLALGIRCWDIPGRDLENESESIGSAPFEELPAFSSEPGVVNQPLGPPVPAESPTIDPGRLLFNGESGSPAKSSGSIADEVERFDRMVSREVQTRLSAGGLESAIGYLDALAPGEETANAITGTLSDMMGQLHALETAETVEAIKGILQWFAGAGLVPPDDAAHHVVNVVSTIAKLNRHVALELAYSLHGMLEPDGFEDIFISLRHDFRSANDLTTLLDGIRKNLPPETVEPLFARMQIGRTN